MDNSVYNQIDDSDQDPSQVVLHEDDDLKPQELSGDEAESIVLSTAQHKANFFLTSVTIMKTVIGSSILSIPYVVRQMGYVLVLLVFGGAMALNYFGTLLLLKSKNLSRHSNYCSIMYSINRNKMSKAIGSLLIFLNNIGIAIAELIIFKISIRNILEQTIRDNDVLSQFYTQEYFIVALVAVIEIPAVLVSKMQKLRFMALAGTGCILVFIVTFVVFFISATFDQNQGNQPVNQLNMFPNNWLRASATVPNILLALSYQMNFFPIFKGLKNASDKKMVQAVSLGLSKCLFSYLLVGILGYAYAGNDVSPNFLQSLSYNKVSPFFFSLINGSFLLSLFFAFPIMFFGGRNNFIALAKLIITKQGQQKSPVLGDQVQEISLFVGAGQSLQQRRRKGRIWFIIYTMVIYGGTIGVAIGVDDIQLVFNVVGAICSTSIALLLPCYFYFRLTILKNQPKTIKYYLSILIFVVMAPYAIFSIIALHVSQE